MEVHFIVLFQYCIKSLRIVQYHFTVVIPFQILHNILEIGIV